MTMIGICGVIALAAALGWVLLRLRGRDRGMLAAAIVVSLGALISMLVSARKASKQQTQLHEACKWMAKDLRYDVEEFENASRQTGPFAQLNLLNVRDRFMRIAVERRTLAELCVETISDCFPMTLGSDTKERALAAADALENHTACRK
jgi:hypothetical protein